MEDAQQEDAKGKQSLLPGAATAMEEEEVLEEAGPASGEQPASPAPPAGVQGEVEMEPVPGELAAAMGSPGHQEPDVEQAAAVAEASRWVMWPICHGQCVHRKPANLH